MLNLKAPKTANDPRDTKLRCHWWKKFLKTKFSLVLVWKFPFRRCFGISYFTQFELQQTFLSCYCEQTRALALVWGFASFFHSDTPLIKRSPFAEYRKALLSQVHTPPGRCTADVRRCICWTYPEASGFDSEPITVKINTILRQGLLW